MRQIKTIAILVAAGRGRRAGGDRPKQWQCLAGARVFDHALAALVAHPQIDDVIAVIQPEDEALLPEGLTCVHGGQTRAASVRAGLEAARDGGFTHVLVHDAARACLPIEVTDRVMRALEAHDAAAPALPVTDALWRSEGGTVAEAVPRADLHRAQTPQGFALDAILAAHERAEGTEADDVEIARNHGIDVAIVEGHEDNLKLTHPGDFARAERILGGAMDIRLGNGFDVHAFTPGDHVVLCGVSVPHERSLKGHSDADVGMHAVTDAIYGALAQGDIGRHFPPSDARWEGAASYVFLEHACTLALEMGFEISNIDCTLICERPKVGPHADAMQAEMARIMGLEPVRVSIKATTSERLGFTGREEGIAALATATLVKS